MSEYTELYNQAVIGHDQSALNQLKRRPVNLAVMKDALSEQSVKYLNKLNIRKLREHDLKLNPYCSYLHYNDNVNPRRLDAEIDRALEVLPEKEGRLELVNDIKDLCCIFSSVVNKKPKGLVLLAMDRRIRQAIEQANDWHTDAHAHNGIITLRGKEATIWRPNNTMPKNKDRERSNYGAVKMTEEENIQHLEPQDFAMFKGRKMSNPLVHASPQSKNTTAHRLLFFMCA
jgi:hypothetical protein